MQKDWSIPAVTNYVLSDGQIEALTFYKRFEREGGFVGAIKFLRAEFHIGLKEAKDFADHIFGRV